MSNNNYDPYAESTVLAGPGYQPAQAGSDPYGQPSAPYQQQSAAPYQQQSAAPYQQQSAAPYQQPSAADPYGDATVLASGATAYPASSQQSAPGGSFDDATVLAPQGAPQPGPSYSNPAPAYDVPSYQQPAFEQPSFAAVPPPANPYGAPAAQPYAQPAPGVPATPYAQPFGMMPQKRNQPLALAGFICGLVGLMALMSPIFAVVGLTGAVLSAIGMKACNDEPEKYSNKWMGIVGIVTGFLSLLFALLWVVFFVWLGTLNS